jgi:CarboxypepD_reg-like domain
MLNKKLLIILILLNFSLFSQIKGKVIDEKNTPIPFVNIAIENENFGTTSEENGEFRIRESDKNKNLIFTAIGFDKKVSIATENLVVVLKPSEYQLDEIIILKKFGTKEKEIGKTDNAVFQAFDNGPRIDTKFFPYNASYKKTKFIKQFSIQTDSKLENASLKIHFYSVDENGYPLNELLNKNFIVSVTKGIKKSIFNISNLNLVMPKNGIFVGFEKLIIDKNKFEKTIFDSNTKISKSQVTYYPLALYNYVERDFQFFLSGGKWKKETNLTSNTTNNKLMIYEPAINLILSN